ncbi:putative membrane protein [Pedobacter sp. AK013]|uniref:DUF4345 domain-containing protein n=1 Tax=Pedobacter sp. AK013 TaxID=2723071 RepID=UPI00161CE04F|nr:DUF4345 domain-containing protein [Pedobacter sp. AK013]MBB6238984.1 putative membrane protein [Pedobacter sp. AK013]
MNTQKIIKIGSQIYIGLSIFSIAYVSVLSVYSPQATMDLVATRLSNTDAISSIRGIYGGVGLVICFSLVYLLLNDVKKALIFLSLFWLAYSISRLITILVDGPLGEFGLQWLVIESTLGILALVLLLLYRRFR